MSEKRPKLAAPPGACDTHMHFYDAQVPGAPGTFMPGHFPVEAYAAMQKRVGLERVVVVQPNAYADDNRVTLDAIARIGKGAKGVGVVKFGVTDAELERLTKAGICALRIMTLHGGALGFEVMDAMMARVHPFGWHANIQLDGRELPKHEERIKRLPGKFVIDHTGKFLEPVAVDSEPFKALLRLVDTGRCWVKLSAGYRISTEAPPYRDLGPFARQLVATKSDRLIWGTDWPHVNFKRKMPNTTDLLDYLLEWVPDEDARLRILVQNPQALYGF